MKSIVVVSDIHVGSRLAVCTPKAKMSDGSTYIANRAQLALYEAWNDVVSSWKYPDILVINGEPIDGQQGFNRGTEVWTTNYLDQINTSVNLLRTFYPKKIYMTRGSNYHVEINGVPIEQIVGEKLNAETVDGQKVVPELFLNVGGVKFNFAHHIAGTTSGWVYRHTPSSKEAMLMALNAKDKHAVDVVVRSHNHVYSGVFGPTYLAITTPGWQLQTWLGFRKTAAGSIPHIGAIRFTVENEEVDWKAKIYRMPEWKPSMVKA